MKELRSVMIDYYLDYRNNYLTVDVFAEHNGLTVEHAKELLELGKLLINTQHPMK